MKRVCRILSMGLGVVLGVILIVSVTMIINKSNRSKVVYAETIKFSTTIGGFEMLIDNELVLDSSLVKITPSNCSFQPTFSVKKYGEDDEVAIVGNIYSFSAEGKYTLYCKIKASDNYDITDSIIINVVSNLTEDTSMYISKLPLQTFYVDEIVDISSLAEIKGPNLSMVSLSGSEHISIQNGQIKTLKDGVASVYIKLTYDHISIMETVLFIVKPKIEETGIDLILSINGRVLDKNELEIEYSQFSFAINYELTNLEHNQNVNCWTDSNIIDVVSYNAPIIILKPLGVGTAIIHVSPLAHPQVVFEIMITII